MLPKNSEDNKIDREQFEKLFEKLNKLAKNCCKKSKNPSDLMNALLEFQNKKQEVIKGYFDPKNNIAFKERKEVLGDAGYSSMIARQNIISDWHFEGGILNGKYI
jgi:hypothetical protein